jgi:peroxiredoxin
MKILPFIAALFILPFSVMAESYIPLAVPDAIASSADTMTVGKKLQAKQDAFSAKADPQKIKDFNDGVQAVAESGVLERAKKTGDIAPDFTLLDSKGDTVQLSELLKTGPVVMIWYRGEWCPYCNIALQDIQSHYDAFEQAGAHVVAISPETTDRALMAQGKLDLDFHVLSDEQSKAAEEYGVAYTLPKKIAGYLQDAFDIHTANNDERNLLPLAASYVIAQDGTISYAYLDADYRKRAETTTLITEVQKLKK